MSNINSTYRDLRSIKQRIKSLILKSSSLATSATANGSATPDTTNEPATVDPASVTEQPEPYFMVRDEDGTATELFLVRRRQCDRGVRVSLPLLHYFKSVTSYSELSALCQGLQNPQSEPRHMVTKGR